MSISVSRAAPATKQRTGLGQGQKPKRSPLAGWFGRRSNEDESLPAMDVSGGLTRAMRLVQTSHDMHVRNTTREPIRVALCAIENALSAIDRVRDAIEEGFELVISAQETDDPASRAIFADRYDELRLSIETLAEATVANKEQGNIAAAADVRITAKGDTDEARGLTLVGGDRRQIDVQLGGQAHYSVSPTSLDASADGLNLSPPRDAFSTDEEILDVLEELDRALQKADRAAASYCRDAQFLIARLELAELP
ncbi:MAG: hypothetical protein AAF720_00315 [Pseudomonadota bacterium]